MWYKEYKGHTPDAGLGLPNTQVPTADFTSEKDR